jgi:hypothetical protein
LAIDGARAKSYIIANFGWMNLNFSAGYGQNWPMGRVFTTWPIDQSAENIPMVNNIVFRKPLMAHILKVNNFKNDFRNLWFNFTCQFAFLQLWLHIFLKKIIRLKLTREKSLQQAFLKWVVQYLSTAYWIWKKYACYGQFGFWTSTIFIFSGSYRMTDHFLNYI